MSTKIALLPGEQVLMSSDKDVLTLTTKRVRYDAADFGSPDLISITLDSVATCGIVTQSAPINLLIAAVVFVGALTLSNVLQQMFLVAACILGVSYFFTRQTCISIASNGGQTILVPIKGISRSSIVEFLDAVERQKLKLAERPTLDFAV